MKRVILILAIMLVATTLITAAATEFTKQCKFSEKNLVESVTILNEQRNNKEAFEQFAEDLELFKNDCGDSDFSSSEREKFNKAIEELELMVTVGKFMHMSKTEKEETLKEVKILDEKVKILAEERKAAAEEKRKTEAYKNRKNYDAWGLDLFIGNASSLSLSEEMDKLNNDDEYTLSGRCDVVDVTAFDGQYGIKCANRYKNLKATLYTTDRQKAISLRKGSSFMYEKLPISNFYTTKEIQVRDNVEYSRHTQHFENIERLSNEVVGIVELVY